MNSVEHRFKSNKGYLDTSGLSRDLRYQLEKLIDSGKVFKAKHGLYAHKKYLREDDKVLIAEMIPNGVFCLFTAWQQYGFTTTIASEYHVALHRNTKIKTPGYPPIAIHYWSDKVYALGITEIKENGSILKFYDRERSVCDAVKFRNKVGEDIMQEVIKSYFQLKNKDIDRLMQYAVILRVEKILAPYIKSLL
ncbi:type IV toxin-antitoxin system AbiEi family antitoxin domain-containing protein [Niabella hirudinis]|uniref:type IV toxin-antitoxin system AbiEi family antitoxin domain-containing protein n=1 Tax=Niabella hirudinis TaxID=1285929 RepID=UPI003EBC463C